MISAGSAFSQTSKTLSVQGIDVTLSLDKTNIAVGEPVIFNITMVNVSEQPVIEMLGNFQLSEGNNIEVMVQPSGELEFRNSGAFEPGTYPEIPLQLFRNAPLSVDTLLLFDRKQPSGLLFSKPGEYQVDIKFQFRLGGSTTLSAVALPTVQIKVTPAADENKQALALLNEPNHIRALHLGVIPTTGILSAIEDTAARYPSTSLGTLAVRAQGHYYARGNGNDYKRGVKLLHSFLSAGIVPVEQDGTAWNIMTACHVNKNYDLAREWAFVMLRNYPESIRIRVEDALLYFYCFAPAQFAAGVPWYLMKSPWIVPGVEPPTDLKPRKGEGQ